MSDQPNSPGEPSHFSFEMNLTSFQVRFLQRLEYTHRHFLRVLKGKLGSLSAEEIANPTGIGFSFIQGLTPDQPSEDETRRWVASCTLRDSAEVLSMLCDELYKFLKLIPVFKQGKVIIPRPITRDWEFQDFLDELAGKDAFKFEKWSFKDKLDSLESEFGIKPGLRVEVESINRARRCLVHRLGWVGKTDALDADGKALHIVFHAMGLQIRGKDGSVTPLRPPMEVQGGSSIELAYAIPRRLEFARATRITIDPQDLVFLLFTQFKFAQSLINEVSRVMKAAGLPERPAPPA